MDKRTAVFKALEERLAALARFETIIVGRTEETSHPRPVVMLIFMHDVQERISKDIIKDHGFVFHLRVIADEGDDEDYGDNATYELFSLMAAVEEKIEEDRKLGGLLRDLIPGDPRRPYSVMWESLYTDVALDRAGADLVLTAVYART